MLVTGIKSKPVYAPLAPDRGGKYHLLLGQGSGGASLLRLLNQMHHETVPSGVGPFSQDKAHTQVLYATESVSGNSCAEKLHESGVADVKIYATVNELLADLRPLLCRCTMGTRVYIAGSESFIGLATKSATEFDLNRDEIQAEECGTRARRVYCIHCRTCNETVKTNVVQCTGCQRWLLVRDHYSRRLAAYMGVMVDAETPGQIPAVEEVFQ